MVQFQCCTAVYFSDYKCRHIRLHVSVPQCVAYKVTEYRDQGILFFISRVLLSLPNSARLQSSAEWSLGRPPSRLDSGTSRQCGSLTTFAYVRCRQTPFEQVCMALSESESGSAKSKTPTHQTDRQSILNHYDRMKSSEKWRTRLKGKLLGISQLVAFRFSLAYIVNHAACIMLATGLSYVGYYQEKVDQNLTNGHDPLSFRIETIQTRFHARDTFITVVSVPIRPAFSANT